MRRTVLLFLALVALGLAVHLHHAQAQSNNGIGYFNNTNAWSAGAETCHVVTSQTGQPGANLALYGIHVTNTNGSTEYAAIFPGTVVQPSNGAVIPGGGWQVLTKADRDINTVELGLSNSGTGVIVCLSSTQGTFTAVTGGYFWVLYQGFAAPSPTPTATPTATPT